MPACPTCRRPFAACRDRRQYCSRACADARREMTQEQLDALIAGQLAKGPPSWWSKENARLSKYERRGGRVHRRDVAVRVVWRGERYTGRKLT